MPTDRSALHPNDDDFDPADDAARVERPAARTIGELRASGWRSRSVKDELRSNLLARLGEGRMVLPGVIGYDDTVLPAVENAILAGQDLVFLGERGQAKTRMARLLVGLLDPWLPTVAGGELNDDPFAPISPAARALVAEGADETPDRLAAPRSALRREAGHPGHHDRRPDRRGRPDPGRRGPLPVRRADHPLRPDPAREPGHLRAQRAARPGRADPGRPAQHPRGARRPDPRLHDPAAARPVRGRQRQPRGLHQPGPDHHPAQGPPRIPDPDPLPADPRRTRSRSCARRSSASRSRKAVPAVHVPPFIEEIVAELTHLARRSGEISQRSGVSVRVSVANLEVLEAAALKRAVRLGEPAAAPADQRPRRGRRLDRRQDRARIGRRRIARGAHRRAPDHQGGLCRRSTGGSRSTTSSDWCPPSRTGSTLETGDRVHSAEYVRWASEVPGLADAIRRTGVLATAGGEASSEAHSGAGSETGAKGATGRGSARTALRGPASEAALVASAIEFLLEGLHLARRLNKDRLGGAVLYRR